MRSCAACWSTTIVSDDVLLFSITGGTSVTEDPTRHGTFNDVLFRLPMIRDMGFDVLYLPPIHPIGTAHRKGKNNSVTCLPGEPGVPYGIGSAEGGHDAIHAELGTVDDAKRRAVEVREVFDLASLMSAPVKSN